MAQKSLYRKFRPKTFAEYKGDFINACVKRFEDPEKRPQVILLHGVHGCGKTTAARLLAGYYLCESPVDGVPCGKCAGCLQVLDLIESGEDDASSESVVEINGSVVNGVDDIRKLMNDSMLTLPAFSKYKVFIIDECHRITSEAQNALLKILEDIPKHLIIIFATTEPEKLLPTILSRSQLTIEVRRQTVANMAEILTNICKSEGFSFGKKALETIAKKGGRIPRDCINLLEDVAGTYDGQITLANVLERTGETDTALYFRFIEAAHSGLADILTFISEFSQGDISYKKFVGGLSRFVLDAVYIRMYILTDDYDANYLKTVKKLFERYTVNEFHVLLRLVDEASRRSLTEAGSTDLALSVLALKIGDITKEQGTVSADSMQAQTISENIDGAKKFVEHEKELRVESSAQKNTTTSLDDFMAELGAVRYVTE